MRSSSLMSQLLAFEALFIPVLDSLRVLCVFLPLEPNVLESPVAEFLVLVLPVLAAS